MKKFKKSFNCIMYNIKTLIGFELFYKIITLLIFSPLFLNLFNFIMKITGYNYLTFENMFSFLVNPITIILLIILILLLLVYTMFDITAIIVILDMSYNEEKISIIDVIGISLIKIKSIFRIDNLFLALFVLVLVPFLSFGLSGGVITSFNIPEFIIDYINNNVIYLGIFAIFMFFLYVLFLRWIYSLHYMILEKTDFKEARKRSARLGKKNFIGDVIVFVAMILISNIIYIVLTFIGVFVIIGIDKLLGDWLLVKSFVTAIVGLFLAILLIGYVLLSVPISYSIISVLFYQHKIENDERIVKLKYNKRKSQKITNKYINYLAPALFVLALVFGTFFTYEMYKGKYNFNIEYVRTTEITAHRGASLERPENTMVAFVEAENMGADWIELDVQQTQDKKLIIMHDDNFKRTTGKDINVWEITYERVRELDAGSFFDAKYKNERIPLLDDVVRWAKLNYVKLNIELKPTGHEEDLVEMVNEIIDKYNFYDDCVITSHDYKILEEIKDHNERIKTVYVTSFAYGKITELEKVDAFSVEASSVNEKLVSRVHNEGKELYVWTINTEDNIKKMIDLNVDNIITDNIVLAKNTVYESRNSNLVNEFIRIINSLFI